jgi:hypothetical protein
LPLGGHLMNFRHIVESLLHNFRNGLEADIAMTNRVARRFISVGIYLFDRSLCKILLAATMSLKCREFFRNLIPAQNTPPLPAHWPDCRAPVQG